MALQIVTKVLTHFSQNARLLYCTETKEGVFLDPPCQAETLLKLAQDLGVTVKGIWLTHAHPDHCGGVAPLKRLIDVPFFAHAEGRSLRSGVSQFITMFNLESSGMEDCPEPDVVLAGGDTVQLGNLEFKVLYTPGHSPDHLCFYCAEEGGVFTGDTIFAGSIGRSDLPGGDYKLLMRSLHEIILKLPPTTKVYSGHGTDTVIKDEIASNPFIRKYI